MNRRHLYVHLAIVGALLVVVGVARALDWLDFFAPWWLTALLLLPFFTWMAGHSLSGLPSRSSATSATLRALLFILLVLCLADARYVLKNKGLAVLFAMDRSASIPEHVWGQELGYVNAVCEKQGKEDRAGIVVFGADASIEIMPEEKLQVQRIHSAVNRNYTNLENVLRLSTAAFPRNMRKKIVLITDGNENDGNLLDGVRFAAGDGVGVDILPVSYEFREEVLVEKVYLPDKIKQHETFDLNVVVIALQECDATLYLSRNDVALIKDGQKVHLTPGRNTFPISLKLTEPGFYVYKARISSPHDTILSNNEGSSFVYIEGTSRVLFVASTLVEVQLLMKACQEEQLETLYLGPESMPQTLGELQAYDCIVLANVEARNFAKSQMEAVRAAVRDLGAGLIMIGGGNSFGAGGYYGTPIEEVLPVSMDVRQRKVNPKGALALILHTCEFANGNYWAKQITKSAIEVLNPMDEAGVLLYDYQQNGDAWLFPLREREDGSFMYGKIDGANPGDMPSFAPCFSMALQALSKSDAMTKHIIVISDGDPQPPAPKDVEALADAGITVSTVGINPHDKRNVDVLKYIAQKTGGRYYFAEDPRTLPRIFVNEAKIVQRGLIFSEPFQPQLILSDEITKGISPGEVPMLMAYVVTTPKDRATVAMVSDNENHDPILASWQFGLGKAVAFTSDATSNWGQRWVTWTKYGKFWGQAIRWAARKREKSDLSVRTQLDGSKGKLVIDAIDERGNFKNFFDFKARLVDPLNQGHLINIRQTAPGRYEGEFEAKDAGVNLVSLLFQDPVTGQQGALTTGVSVPYSPEYQYLKTNVALLQRAAELSGGQLLSGKAEQDRVFFSRQPPSRDFQPIWERLLLVALLVFFVDVFIRRVVISRKDVAVAWARVLAALRLRRPVESDQMMKALLQRKQQVVAQREKVSADALREFKARLEQSARAAAGRPGAPPVETTAAPPGTPATSATPPSGPPASGPPAPAAEADSYTGRLLAAKRRTRKTPPDDPK